MGCSSCAALLLGARACAQSIRFCYIVVVVYVCSGLCYGLLCLRHRFVVVGCVRASICCCVCEMHTHTRTNTYGVAFCFYCMYVHMLAHPPPQTNRCFAGAQVYNVPATQRSELDEIQNKQLASTRSMLHFTDYNCVAYYYPHTPTHAHRSITRRSRSTSNRTQIDRSPARRYNDDYGGGGGDIDHGFSVADGARFFHTFAHIHTYAAAPSSCVCVCTCSRT